MSRLNLTRERDLAAEWDLPLEQFRVLRRRHRWAHVAFSRQDVRYTDAQVEQIVHDMTRRDSGRRSASESAGLTKRSAARAS